MQYLLLARFSMDDIPLRLYYNRAMAEEAARAIDADPGLLSTKWKRSLAAWPHGVSGGFVGMIVMSISEVDGYPEQVTFDSTDYVPPDETVQPAAPAPPDPSGPSLATDNGTTLASAARSLDAENADLRRRVVDLEAQVRSLISEKVCLVSKSEELQRNNVAYSRTNDELRVLNEDLNHQLNATQARASRATDLEVSLRGTAQHLLSHFQQLEDRTKWSLRFADEGLLPAAYCKAMQHCQRRFAEQFEVFLRTYPHVLPDIPGEYRPYDDSDDEMND